MNACSYSSPYRPTKPNEILESKYLIHKVPDISWEITKSYDRNKWKYEEGTAGISKQSKGFDYEIHIRTQPYRDGVVNRQLFDKDSLIDDSDVHEDSISERSRAMGVTYEKGWISYIKGMRCAGGVFSRSFGGNVYSATSKNYSIGCGYYDKKFGKRILNISYRYYGGTGDTKLQGSQDEKNITPKEAEEELKEALKEILQTLHIKRFDKERMIQEGLYHPERKFESTKW